METGGAILGMAMINETAARRATASLASGARNQLCVRAAHDVEALPRIIGLFAQRGLVPEQLSCRRSGAFLIIDIEVEAVDPMLLEILLQKLRALVLIDRASIVGSRT